MGAGMYQVAGNLAPAELRPGILGQIVDRLAVDRPGRAHFYIPQQTRIELHRFVKDFVAWAEVCPEDLEIPDIGTTPLERPVHEEVLRAIRQERDAVGERAELSRRLTKEGFVTMATDSPAVKSILGFGWSNPESWGTWTDGEFATLRIPVPPGRPWQIQIRGIAFPESGSVRIGHGWSLNSLEYQTFEGHEPVQLSLDTMTGTGNETLVLHLPSATSPNAVGISTDDRVLGFGLTGVVIKGL